MSTRIVWSFPTISWKFVTCIVRITLIANGRSLGIRSNRVLLYFNIFLSQSKVLSSFQFPLKKKSKRYKKSDKYFHTNSISSKNWCKQKSHKNAVVDQPSSECSVIVSRVRQITYLLLQEWLTFHKETNNAQ